MFGMQEVLKVALAAEEETAGGKGRKQQCTPSIDTDHGEIEGVLGAGYSDSESDRLYCCYRQKV